MPRDLERPRAVVRGVDGPRERLARREELDARARSLSLDRTSARSGVWPRVSGPSSADTPSPSPAARMSPHACTTRGIPARRRRALAVEMAIGEASPNANLRPSAWALSPVVPLPAKRSTTRPPGGDAHAMTRSRRDRGFCVGNPVRSAGGAWRSGATSVHSASTRRSRHHSPSASFTRKYLI